MDSLSWNLKLNNTTLAKAFLRLIESERKRLRMPNPKKNKGRKLRHLSWRPIELLDIQLNGVRVLNNAESSQVSKARKLYSSVVSEPSKINNK
jgi:hypothetical protein